MAEYLRLHRSPVPELPEEVVREILSWLPAKSLMRFKCVSRLWLSIILAPSFARSHRHRGAFRGLLIYGCFWERRQSISEFFYMSIDGPNKQISHHLSVDHGGKAMGCTQPVNGLVCFYYRNYSYLYNIATRESLQLPLSTNEAPGCTYHLGFDPISKLYKLLKICPVYINYDDNPSSIGESALFVENLNCEILQINLGEGGEDAKEESSWLSWRSIDSTHWDIRKPSVCYDGVLYWDRRDTSREDRSDNNNLIAFDLCKEIFFNFPIPKDVFYLTRFGPGLSIHTNEIRELGEAKMICYQGGGGGGPLPTEFMVPMEDFPKFPGFDLNGYDPLGMLPDGKVMLHENYYDSHRFPPAIYYTYDPTTQELEMIVIPKLTLPTSSSSSPFKLCAEVDCGYKTNFKENIISLKCLGRVARHVSKFTSQ